MTQNRPNVLMIMADQYRADWIGAAGASWVHTPNIDSIAERGVLFNRAYTNCPICAPARVSLATGIDPVRNGELNNNVHLDLSRRTYYQELRDAGYRVGCVGKLDLAKNDFEMGKGDRPMTYSWGFTDPIETEGKMSAGRFDQPPGPYTRMLAEHDLFDAFHNDYLSRQETGWVRDALHDSVLPTFAHSDTYVGERSVEWLRTVPDGNPWHLFVTFVGPHDPFDPPTEYADMYRDAEVPLPPVPAYTGASERVQKRVLGLNEADVRTSRRQYAALIHLMDDWVGRILGTLREIGAADNTIVIFTSDHGEMLGDMGIYQKTVPYEPSIRIPLVAAGPGIARGMRSDALVELSDLNPSICDLCGVAQSAGMDARSFLPTLRDPGAGHREAIVTAFQSHRTIVDASHKLVRYVDEGIVELYDLVNDPYETANLAGSQPEIVRRLETAMHARLVHRVS